MPKRVNIAFIWLIIRVCSVTRLWRSRLVDRQIWIFGRHPAVSVPIQGLTVAGIRRVRACLGAEGAIAQHLAKEPGLLAAPAGGSLVLDRTVDPFDRILNIDNARDQAFVHLTRIHCDASRSDTAHFDEFRPRLL